MPALLDLDLRPSLLLAMWAGGLAVAVAVVAWRRVVGAAFVWVAGGAALLIGVFAAFGGPLALAGAVAVGVGTLVARRAAPAAALLGIGGVLLVAHAAGGLGLPMAIAGAVALGGVTAEMLLGHWYLVDPTLPRAALRRLCLVGIAGLVADGAVLLVSGAMGAPSGSLVAIWAGLAGFSLLLMVGVWFSLKEEGYEGVMAATGLSYLAVLTSLGAVALGRSLVVL